MRQRVINNRFIGDLIDRDLRAIRPGAPGPRIGLSLAVKSLIKFAVSAGYEKLGALIGAGDAAQALRDGESLKRVSEQIRVLPLDDAALSIADYYCGLSVCRLGASRYSEANELFSGVADAAPLPFRAKALVALGTNLAISGDVTAGQCLHSEAARLAAGVEDPGVVLPVVFYIGMTRTFASSRDGDHVGALLELERLLPTTSALGREFPALLHHYQNNRASELAAAGRLEEAQGVAAWLLRSPFLGLYAESQRTCEEIAWKTRRPSRSTVAIGELFTEADKSAPPESPKASQAGGGPARMDSKVVSPQVADRKAARPVIVARSVAIPTITIQSAFPSAIADKVREIGRDGPSERPPGQKHPYSRPVRGPPGGKDRVH